MPNTIGSLIIDLVANTASFTTTLNKAVSDVESSVLKMKTAFGSLAEVFTIAGIAELTKSTLEFGDQLEKSALKTGNSAKAISELAFAARQVNIDLPELTSAFEKMEKVISTAGTGNKAATDAFNALGIAFDQIIKLSPDQQFEEIANQISKLSDPTDKARAAIAIFGRAGAELLPLFEQGAAGIELARQKAIDFGASLDTDQIKKLAEASTAVKDLGESFKGLATTLAAKAAPAMKDFLDSLTSTITGNQGEFLERRLTTLHALFDAIPSDSPGNTVVGNLLQGQILHAEMQLAGLKLAKQLRDGLASGSALTDNTPPGFNAPQIDPIDTSAQKIQVSAMAKFYSDLDDATKTGTEKVLDDTIAFQTKLELLYDDKKISAGLFAVRESATADATELTSLLTTNQAQIAQGIKQSMDDLKESYKSASEASKLAAENMKADFDKTKNNAMQTAQSIEDSFATFLVDPFSGGLKKMLAAWVATLEQMAAKAAAQSIFKSLFGGTVGGLGGIFMSLLGGGATPDAPAPAPTGGYTPSFASGGSWMVGGNGGTDSQMVRFRASPNERVTVSTPAQQAQMGGVILHQTVNIDARSDAAQIRELVGQSTRFAIQQSTAQVVNMVKRGAFTG